jgi:acetyltransferase-like isoleucine patch superfamily enzyme
MSAAPAAKKPYIHPKALVETRKIGTGTRVWAFAHVMKGAVIGRDCNVGDHSFVEEGVIIGDRVTVKNGVSVWQGVTLENDVFVGPNAAFTNDLLPISRSGMNKLTRTRVCKGSAIGANATIVCGITIGEHVLIGAGSVVTRDIPAHTLVYGNPARVRAFLCDCREKIKFIKGRARCKCGLTFCKTGAGVTRG